MTHGATPAGVEPGNETAAARQIRDMFARVAPRYDLLNRLLSASVDQHWRRTVARRLRPYLQRPNLRLMDLCCGTADLLIALEDERSRLAGDTRRPALGSDFCRPMLSSAKQKLARLGLVSCLVEADGLVFPLADESLDVITIAYGFRNFSNYQRGLKEMYRLLARGGCLAILDFSEPRALWGTAFRLYFRHILPGLGNAISGSTGAYSYLQSSVASFLSPEELAAAARETGFGPVEFHLLTGGISVLHLAHK
jgi:demethylmenaquinone methyltransferase/2-methoxy-6-polyprenyl-1,4-benzoquinol methylase